jgi:hypothetical protein
VTGSSGPERIYLVRHGEKLGDPCATDDDADLSIAGSARAAALPSLFVPATPGLGCAIAAAGDGFMVGYSRGEQSGTAPRFTAPDFVFAAKPAPKSNRPVETATPLAAALSLTCDDRYEDGDYADLANELKSNPVYTGKTVLVCWHHGNLAKLAEEFVATGVPTWDCTVFDLVWQIDCNPPPATLTSYPQRLLYGDSAA